MTEHIDRPKFREIRYNGPDRTGIPDRYDIVEAKMDGIWGCLILEKGYYRMYSRTGKIKAVGEIPKWDDKREKCILLGELTKQNPVRLEKQHYYLEELQTYILNLGNEPNVAFITMAVLYHAQMMN